MYPQKRNSEDFWAILGCGAVLVAVLAVAFLAWSLTSLWMADQIIDRLREENVRITGQLLRECPEHLKY